jgi:hypothetical protein
VIPSPRTRTQGDDPDLIYIVRTLPLGVEDVYAFPEDASQHAVALNARGKRAYVVPRAVKTSYEENGTAVALSLFTPPVNKPDSVNKEKP